MTMGQPLRMPPPPRREIAGAETCRAPAQVTWNARRLGRAADGARAAALGAGVPASVVEAALDAWRAAAEGMALLPFVAWASEDDVLGHRVWGERFLRILGAVATAEDRSAARAAAAACAARRGSAVARREALIQCGWRLGLQFGSAAAWEHRGRDAGYARSSSSSSAETVSSLSSDDEGDKGPPPSPFATLLRAFVERTALGLGGDEARDLAARCEALLEAAARCDGGAPCAPLGAGVLTLAEVLDACRSTSGACGGPLALEVLAWLEGHVRAKVAAGPAAAPRPQRRLAATGAGSSEALFANFLADFGQAANATFCTRAWRRYAFEPRTASFVSRWARACCECLVRGAGAQQVHARARRPSRPRSSRSSPTTRPSTSRRRSSASTASRRASPPRRSARAPSRAAGSRPTRSASRAAARSTCAAASSATRSRRRPASPSPRPSASRAKDGTATAPR